MQIINEVQQRLIGKNYSTKSTQMQNNLFAQMVQAQSKAISKSKEAEFKGLETLERSEISLTYPPSTTCKGMEALTEEVIAQLREKYDFQNMGRNFKEFQEFVTELKRRDIISEKDVQDMPLGEPMFFDEKGQPNSWLNCMGKTGEGRENGEEESSLAKLYQKKAVVCEKLSGIIQEILGE